MTPYYMATVHRIGYLFVFHVCLLFSVYQILLCTPATMTVLGALCCSTYMFSQFSTFCLENALWSSVWVNSSLNSVFSPQQLLIHLCGWTFTLLLNRLSKVKAMAFRCHVCKLTSENCACVCTWVTESFKRWLIEKEKGKSPALLECVQTGPTTSRIFEEFTWPLNLH